jgi:hypothetical protein
LEAPKDALVVDISKDPQEVISAIIQEASISKK